MDERPTFSIRALPAPSKINGDVNKRMCLSSIDYPYVMRKRMMDSKVQSYVVPNYTDYLKGGETIDGKPISIF